MPQTVTAAWEPSWGGVLTVDQNGIVKLTEDQKSIGYGLCPNDPTNLTSNVGIKMNNQRIYYSGMSRTSPFTGIHNSMGIGYNCGDFLPGKLSVDQTWTSSPVLVNTIAGYFHNGDVADCPDEMSPEIIKTAVKGVSDGISGHDNCHFNINVGGDFEATNCYYANYGVRGSANDPIGASLINIGGMFVANNAAFDNIGVAGITAGRSAGLNIGVYGESPFTGNCGPGFCTDAAGFFNGDIYSTSGNYYPSDLMLKDNIQPLTNSVDIIKALNPKTYNYRINQFPKMRLLQGVQSGLIAQDVQTLLPNLISWFKIPALPDSIGHVDTTGTNTSFMGINYVGLIPYLIGALKEQIMSSDSLAQKLSDLQDQINNCCSATGHLRKSIDIEIIDVKTIILEQNSPNPFREETYIKYVIPAEVSKAMIIIHDKVGNVLKTVVIEERGEGSLHVYAEKLSSGIYTYSLVTDGITFDTKQMICTK